MLNPTEKGQSLLEVLIVLSVAAIVLLAIVLVATTGLKNAQFAQNQAKATKYAQEALEAIKMLRDRNETIQRVEGQAMVEETFEELLDENMGNLCKDTDGLCYFALDGPLDFRQVVTPSLDRPVGSVEEGLLRRIYFEDLTGGMEGKKVTVQVIWQDSSGEHKSDLQTVLRKLNPVPPPAP